MRFSVNILNEDERQRLHAQSLRILHETGVRFLSQQALGILEKGGARVDWDEKIAYIPPELVAYALETAPKTFILGARNPAYNHALPSPVSRYCTDGTAAFAIDFETGKRRYGSGKDNEDALRVFQQMDLGVMTWAPVSASDAPAGSRPLHEFFSLMKFGSKHVQHELHTLEQVPFLAEGLEAVSGSQQAVRESKHHSLIYCPIAPLSHDGPMLDAYLELGAYDLPVSVLPMPVSGSTGPASLFASASVVDAENLSALLVFQLAHPGRPVTYGSATGILNFMTGDFLGGTPEMGLMSAAAAEMARFYGLPSLVAGMTSDANQPGPEAVLEKFVSTVPVVAAGADIIVGYGEIESDQALILEQIVIDNEIAHLVQRLYDGVDSAPDKALLEEIQAIGPGGHFLARRSTRLAARSGEFYHPSLIARQSHDSWEKQGRPDMYAKGRERVREILAGPLVDPLPEQVSARLDEILARADRELG